LLFGKVSNGLNKYKFFAKYGGCIRVIDQIGNRLPASQNFRVTVNGLVVIRNGLAL
jgi:hypothetical protein